MENGSMANSLEKGEESIAVVEGGGRVTRAKILRVPMSTAEWYLLRKLQDKYGFGTMAKTVRTLLANHEKLERAEKLIARFRAWRKNQADGRAIEAELDELCV